MSLSNLLLGLFESEAVRRQLDWFTGYAVPPSMTPSVESRGLKRAIAVASPQAKQLACFAHQILGFYHRPRYGRAALALDLMEPFRPLIADSAVLSAINSARGSQATKKPT